MSLETCNDGLEGHGVQSKPFVVEEKDAWVILKNRIKTDQGSSISHSLLHLVKAFIFQFLQHCSVETTAKTNDDENVLSD